MSQEQSGVNPAAGQPAANPVQPDGRQSKLDALRKAADDRYKSVRTIQTLKKIAFGAVGAAAVVMATNGTAISSAPVPPKEQAVASLQAGQASGSGQTSFADDGPFDATKNHQRWPIKTLASPDPSLQTPVTVDVAEFAKFPAESPGSVQQFKSILLPSSIQPKPGLREGQIVQTDGYVHLVAFEVDDDSDYHVQINDKKTNSPSDLTPCLIVEVPHPSAAPTPALAAQFAAVRKSLRDKCFGGATPTGTVATPLHVRVTGQLFYDLSHSGSSDPGGGRGKKVSGTLMKATTIWEIHPITKIDLLDP